MKQLLAAVALLLSGSTLLAADPADPQGPTGQRSSVFDMSLEQLMETPVTSVSRKETPLSRAAAAVAVITQDDIRRLGITSLPEALRLVPGLEVARINAHSWAIAARGFNSQFSDKLLVLLDGRILYEVRFPGVFWDAQDIVLEDVDRIEVIRGPGATLWGANAVNGVINIITKAPDETAGALVSTSIGTDERPTTSVRYGGRIGSDVTYRVHGKLVNRDGLLTTEGQAAPDAWHARRGGARADWTNRGRDRVTVQSDVFAVRGDELVTRPLLTPPFAHTETDGFSSQGANVLGRWRRDLSASSDVMVQAYYADSTYRDADGGFDDGLVDVELTHHVSPLARHDLVWGAGYRRRANLILDTATANAFREVHHLRHLETAFVQDEITLVPARVTLTLGTKLEHNSDTGLSADPSLRALWTPHRSHTVWGAVSRAVRTPDLFELGARQPVSAFQPGPTSPVVLVSLVGQPGLANERMVAYELGYRTTPLPDVSVEVATFYNRYSDLIGFAPGEPIFTFDPITPHLSLPLNAVNGGNARTFGYEVSAHWNPTTFWRVSPSYTYLKTPTLTDLVEFDSPAHRATVVSSVELPWRVELNAAAYRVSALRTVRIPAYTRLDLGATWRPTASLELGLWGQNLTDDRHVEFFAARTTQLEAVKRSVVAQVTWRPATRP